MSTEAYPHGPASLVYTACRGEQQSDIVSESNMEGMG